MGKITRIIAVLVVLLVCAALTAPYFIGKRVEQRFRCAVTQAAEQSDLAIRVTRYDRSWFGAEATTVVLIDDDRFEIDSDIHHGPFFGLQWATIRSYPQFDAWPKLVGFFDGPPVTITTTLPLSGGYRVQASSPARSGTIDSAKGGAVNVDWGGFSADAEKTGGHNTFELHAPHLQWKSDNNRVVVQEGVHFEANGGDLSHLGVADTPVDWDASSQAQIQNVTISGNDPMGHLTFALSGSSSLNASDEGKLGYKQAIAISDFRIDGPGAENGDAKPIAFDRARLELGLTGLNKAAVESLAVELSAFKDQMDDAGEAARERVADQIGAIALSYVPKILSGTPELRGAIPSVDTSHGALGASVKFGLTPAMDTAATPGSPLVQMLQRAALKAHAFTDSSLLRWIASEFDSSPQVMQTVQQLAQQKLITMDDDRIKSDLYLDAHDMRINDQPGPARAAQRFDWGLHAGIQRGYRKQFSDVIVARGCRLLAPASAQRAFNATSARKPFVTVDHRGHFGRGPVRRAQLYRMGVARVCAGSRLAYRWAASQRYTTP